MKKLVLCVCCFLIAATNYAADKYVSPGGSHTAPYETLATAANDIQTAVDAAAAGETVFVNDGTYVLTGAPINSSVVSITKGITVTSVNGAAVAIVDGGGSGSGTRCLYVNHADAVVNGLTLQNGSPTSANGGGVLMTKGKLSNCTVSGNETVAAWKTGSGIDMTGGTVENCQILNNTIASGLAYGGGVRAGGGLVTGCTISGNTGASRGGGILVGGSALLEDSTITGNSAKDGGGVYCDGTGKVTNCQIVSNTSSEYAGGAHVGGSGVIELCNISNNSALKHGGGARADGTGAAKLDRCTINNNSGKYGAGVNMSGTAQVIDCTISNNTALDDAGSGGVWMEGTCQLLGCTVSFNSTRRTGGIHIGGAVTVSDCTVEGNSGATENCGGINLGYAGALVTHTTVTDNSAAGDGGGVNAAIGTLRNCLITGNDANRGGGVYFPGSACLVESCTIVGNSATASGGVQGWNGSSGQLLNSIVWDNTPANWSWSNPAITSSCTTPLPVGAGNIDAAPQFAGAADYHLQSTSPCVDAGSDQTWMAAATDLDGNTRLSGTVDMGVYELPPPSCDCTAATAAALAALCAEFDERRTSVEEVELLLDGILDTVLPANGCDLNDPCRGIIETAAGL